MVEVRAPAARPLSPHLQIYRWTWTMAMSIFHRATGVGLYLGTALLAVWLLCLSSGPVAYGRVQAIYGSWFGLFVLFCYTWALIHHMLGGVRHLVWDFGHGMEPGTRMAMARGTLIGSTLLTPLVWVIAVWMMR